MESLNKIKLSSECTSLLVGRKMTNDGSMIVARSEDWDILEAKNLEVFKDTENGSTEFVAKDSPFKCELPKKAYGYTALAPYNLHGHWGSAGFNSVGVGMSSTESIFSSDKVLAVDPMPENGVAENSVYNITLPYIKTAKEGALRLGSLIEKYGVAEGFGVGFIDNEEIWYLETACGHRWLACRIPENVYFITGNQSRFRDYDPKDTHNYLASKDLLEFAKKNNLYNPKDKFDFHTAYSRDVELDTTYNYPRVWGIQNMLSPEIKNDVTKNTFPVYAKADHKISIDDMRRVFRFHYNDTEHDPYLHNNPKEVYRPISIFRTLQTHILKVRPELPKAIGEVNYVAFGMADLGVFIPFYQGLTSFIESYTKGTNKFSTDSAYWKLRKVQTLGMVNYNKYAQVIKEVYSKFEIETDQRMKEMEEEYLKIYKNQPIRAAEMIQAFTDKVMQDTLDVTDELTEDLFTRISIDIQTEYMFHGA
ncbi:MAG: C69 family dipeptidase [Bacteroidales bacterium]